MTRKSESLKYNKTVAALDPVLVTHPCVLWTQLESCWSAYLKLRSSRWGIPIWRAWVCRGTRTACRWSRTRGPVGPKPGADCLPGPRRSSGSGESRAWAWAWWRARGSSGLGEGRAWGRWWSEEPEGSPEGRPQWLEGVQRLYLSVLEKEHKIFIKADINKIWAGVIQEPPPCSWTWVLWNGRRTLYQGG